MNIHNYKQFMQHNFITGLGGVGKGADVSWALLPWAEFGEVLTFFGHYWLGLS